MSRQITHRAVLIFTWLSLSCMLATSSTVEARAAQPQPLTTQEGKADDARKPIVEVPVVLQEGVQLRLAQDVVIQPLDRRRAGFQKATPAGHPAQLKRLVRAKVEPDGESGKILLLAPSFRTEKRDVQVTMMRAEERERTVMVDRDGKQEEVTQKYTVTVPFTEKVQRDVLVPTGDKPQSIDWDKASVYRLDGTLVKLEEAAKLLPQLRPVFLIPDQNQPIEAAPELVQQAMKPDTLMIVTNALVPLP